MKPQMCLTRMCDFYYFHENHGMRRLSDQKFRSHKSKDWSIQLHKTIKNIHHQNIIKKSENKQQSLETFHLHCKAVITNI